MNHSVLLIMNMIEAIIIDDEQYCCEVLATLLKKYCPTVKVLAMCSSADEGLSAISQHNPSLVFLDIEMPEMNGFQMLEQLPQINFNLIFTTSYDRYALKAFSFSAMDYLLKPIDRQDLQKAIEKVEQRPKTQINRQLEILMEKITNPQSVSTKVALPTMEGLEIVNTDNIISCTSDSNYTTIRFKNGNKILISKTLKDIEELLGTNSFVRIHNSHVVNLNEITKYVRGEGGYVVMSDGTSLDVSRSRKESLMKRLHRSL